MARLIYVRTNPAGRDSLDREEQVRGRAQQRIVMARLRQLIRRRLEWADLEPCCTIHVARFVFTDIMTCIRCTVMKLLLPDDCNTSERRLYKMDPRFGSTYY